MIRYQVKHDFYIPPLVDGLTFVKEFNTGPAESMVGFTVVAAGQDELIAHREPDGLRVYVFDTSLAGPNQLVMTFLTSRKILEDLELKKVITCIAGPDVAIYLKMLGFWGRTCEVWKKWKDTGNSIRAAHEIFCILRDGIREMEELQRLLNQLSLTPRLDWKTPEEYYFDAREFKEDV